MGQGRRAKPVGPPDALDKASIKHAIDDGSDDQADGADIAHAGAAAHVRSSRRRKRRVFVVALRNHRHGQPGRVGADRLGNGTCAAAWIGRIGLQATQTDDGRRRWCVGLVDAPRAKRARNVLKRPSAVRDSEPPGSGTDDDDDDDDDGDDTDAYVTKPC